MGARFGGEGGGERMEKDEGGDECHPFQNCHGVLIITKIEVKETDKSCPQFWFLKNKIQ